MTNVSFKGTVSNKMQKVVEKAIDSNQLTGKQVAKYYKHILNPSQDKFTYSITKFNEVLPNHRAVSVQIKDENGLLNRSVSDIVTYKEIPQTLNKLISQFLEYMM